MIKYLLKIFQIFTDSEKSICNKLYNQETFDILTNFIRYNDNEIKILGLSVLINILFKCDSNNLKNENMDFLSIKWGIAILNNLICDLKLIKSKINSLKILSK